MTKEELNQYKEFSEKINSISNERERFAQQIIDRELSGIIGKKITIPESAYVHVGKQGIVEYIRAVHNNDRMGIKFKFGGTLLKKNGEKGNFKFDFCKTITPDNEIPLKGE